ncbi:MAG: outer membrane protein assembly factor BamA [Phycisphaerales bacterium JB043]
MALLRLVVVASICCCWTTLSGDAHAQDTSLPAYEGRPIRDVRFEGIQTIDESLLRMQLRSLPGEPIRSETITQDIVNLSRLGKTRTIEARVEQHQDGSVTLVFTLEEAPIIRDVQVTGNRQLDVELLRDIVEGLGLRAGVQIDDFQIGKVRRSIEELYRSRGFYAAEVILDESELVERGNVIFRIREGERVKVTAVRFEGFNTLPLNEFRSKLTTRRATLFRKAPLVESEIEDDIATIIETYRASGFLDIRADRSIRVSPNGREAIITFIVEEGPQYTLRNVTAQRVDSQDGGADDLVFSPEQLAGLIPIKRGDVYSMQNIQKLIRTVQEAYWELGYADMQVRARELRDTVEPVVDLLLIISEGRRFRTGDVIIQGNTLTRQNVIRRHVQVLPGMPLDRGALEETQRRLRATRLFDQQNPARVTVQPEDPSHPGFRDVLVEVEETHLTGNVGFIAAVNSDAGVFGSISISQTNFDISDTPETFGELLRGEAFRGGGQTFSLAVSPGSEVSAYTIALSDPSAWDSDLSFRGALSFRQRIFERYDEDRGGGTIVLGRRMGDRWVASLSYRANSVELNDIDPIAPVDVFAVQEQNIFHGIALRLSRTTVPVGEEQSPSRGIRTTLSAEQVVGDFTFSKVGFSQSLFFTVNEDALGRRSKVSLRTSVDHLLPRGEAPVYERLYLGGRQFRGFDFRTVSPKGIRNDTLTLGTDPVGGNWLFFAGIEYEQPLFGEIPVAPGVNDPVLSIVGFIDSGTVLDDISFDDYRVSAGFGLRIRAPALGPAPLAFDFGFPIAKEDSDEEELFSFSVDLPF